MFCIWLPVRGEYSGWPIIFWSALWSRSCSCGCSATVWLSWGWIATDWPEWFFSTQSDCPATSAGWLALAPGFRCCTIARTLVTAVLSWLQRSHCSECCYGLPCCPRVRACFRPSPPAVCLRACWFFVWLFGWRWRVFFRWSLLGRDVGCCPTWGEWVGGASMRGSWWVGWRGCFRLCVLRVGFRSFLNSRL